MAISQNTVWEVRTGGSENNGGGFVAGASGTDFSQQDAAQYGAADLAVDAVTNTKVTSATHTFIASDVGNLMQITAGAGFTQGFYEILSIAAGAATLDRSPALVGTTGGTYAVGGALASPGKAGGAHVLGNIIWVKSGSYTITSATANVAGGCVSLGAQTTATNPCSILGYTTTRGDEGRPTLTASGISTFTVLTCAAGGRIENFIVDCASLTSSRGIAGVNGRVYKCKVTRSTNSGFFLGACILCEATGNSGTNVGGFNTPNPGIGCVSHDNTGTATTNGFYGGTCFFCISYGNQGYGLHDANGAARFFNCTSYGNTAGGLFIAPGAGSLYSTHGNLICYGNGGWGVNVGANEAVSINGLFLGNNTSGAVSTTGVITIQNQVALSADPFVDAPNDNFALNTTAGGGALCRAAGLPVTYPDGMTSQALDTGGAQHGDPVITFPEDYQVYAGVDRGDGVLGTLHASNISLAAGHGSDLTAGDLELGVTVDDVTGTLDPNAGGGGGSGHPVVIGGMSYAG